MYGGGGSGQSGGSNDLDAVYAAAMLAAMESQNKGPKYSKYLEGLLPLALLLILAVFVAARAGFIDLSMLPGMQKTYSILVLSDDPESITIREFQTKLQTGLGEYLNVFPAVSAVETSPAVVVSAEQLANYDVVILYQVKDYTVTLSQRDELYKYVRNGGNLIVIGMSGTCDEDSCSGWGGGIRYDLGEYMPVDCVSGTTLGCSETVVTGKLRLRFDDPNSPINPTPGKQYYPVTTADMKTITLKVVENVRPSRSGRPVATLQKIEGSEPTATYRAIFYSQVPLGGKVVYFAFPPLFQGGYNPFDQVLFKAIVWLAG